MRRAGGPVLPALPAQPAQSAQPAQPARRVRHALALLGAFAAACMLALCVPGVRAYASPSAIDYGGDVVAFYTEDLSSRFGMLSNPSDDVQIGWNDGYVSLSWAPSNTSVFKGFYLHAFVHDESSWDEANFVAVQNGMISLALPDSYCGHGWAVAPLKFEERGGGTSDGQYYLVIPPLEKVKPSVQYVTVTFTDGMGGVVSEQQVAAGESATAPADPVREGFTFAGWDVPFTNVTQDLTVNALWASATSHKVTFADGVGGTILVQIVEDGQAAMAPADPVRDGFVFTGWSPADFSSVKADLTVTAQWLSNDQVSVSAVVAAIDALPADPRSLLRDTSNEQVAAAAARYNAMPADLKGQVPDDARLRLAKCAIAVLPSDPFKVNAAHASAISAAQAVVDSLPEAIRDTLDDASDAGNVANSSNSYGRYLENAVWALDSLKGVNNITLLQAGTYTGQVESTSSMGKTSRRVTTSFTVKSITVSGGKMTAILEQGSNSSQTLKLGGEEYQNLQTDSTAHSYFEIPICLNATFHFSTKGKNATDDTDAISYEMTVTANEDAMEPDAADGGGSGSGGSGGGKGGAGGLAAHGGSGSGSGMNLNALVKGPSSKDSGSSAKDGANTATGARQAGGKSKATVTEVDMGPDGTGALVAVEEDLMPAVAGGALLLASLGVLGFTMRFMRRESAFA